MLSKLLKHEFRATGRVMLPVYLVLFLSAGLFCLTMHLADNYDLRALEIFRGLTAFVFGVTVIGAGIVTLALMVYRFYKNYMTDEGYLMFTLPVATAQLIWSKLLVALVWTVATAAAIVLAVLLATLGQPFWADLPTLRELWDTLLYYVPAGHVAGYAVEFVIAAILSSLGSYLLFYAAIALGHSFANHKIFLSVVFYIAFSIALQTVASFAGIYGIVGLAENDFFNSPTPFLFSHYLMGGVAVAALLVAVVFYLVTYFTLKKRLNLQ